MVRKAGQEDYWEQWAADAAHRAQDCLDRLSRLIARPGSHKQAFEEFLAWLQKNISPSLEPGEVVEMLAQHLVTRPAFEAMFQNRAFVSHNPLSQALQKMAILLEAVEKDDQATARFFEAVKTRLSGLDQAEDRRQTIAELYESFFKKAFPKTAEKPGLVHTPAEVADFINHSVAAVLEKEFGRSLADENVHILDPFTGTGAFMTRLIQSGLIPPSALARKYDRELHANEALLLAYYIASLNIENAYHAVPAGNSAYKPFNGLGLIDTFQLGETDKADDSLLAIIPPPNSGRVQPKAPLRVIIGSPPYSEGRRPAGDQARTCPKLEKRIAATYAAATQAANKNPLYEAPIKAFRWSTDRLEEQHGGLIAFFSNGGWLEGRAMDGFRKCLERDFSSIYVLNLRDGQSASGGYSRQGGARISASGRPSAITVLVKKPGHKGQAVIYYHDLGDGLTREEKLALLAVKRHALNPEIKWRKLQPDRHGDWLNKRNDRFAGFIPLGDKGDKNNKQTVFGPWFSRGLKTNRDAWGYNFSRNSLHDNMKNSMAFYNRQVAEKSIFPALYRPFQKTWAYFNREINNRVHQLPKLFPTPGHENLVICVAANRNELPLIADRLPDSRFNGDSQCFPLHYYDLPGHQKETLFDSEGKPGLRRTGITEFIIKQAQNLYGLKANKEDIFYYVYGLLHSPDYRRAFEADLKKMLPRLPLAGNFATFSAFSQAGRALAKLHLGYEDQPAPPEVKILGAEAEQFQVEKMRFPDKADKSALEYNPWIKITDIPLEAYAYAVNGRPAVEWVMERYQVRTDRAGGLKNDPNDWAREQGNPRYILDLLLSVMTVSLETMKIVRGLPKLEF